MIRKSDHIIQYTLILFVLFFISPNQARNFQVNFRLQPIDYRDQQAISPRYYQGNLTLPCQLEESSVGQRITYYWTHNHQPVQVNHRIILRNGNLTLKWIQLSDAGNYQCFAIHNQGISVSRIATLQLRQLELPFNQSDTIAVQSLHNGQYARLTCPIPPSTNPLPNSIYWTGSNDNYIIIQKRPHLYQSSDDGTLHFAFIQQSDSSIYRCHTVFQLYDPMAQNYVTVVNHGQRQMLNISRAVRQSTTLSSPVQVITAPVDQVVQVGEKSVQFQCIVAGNSSTFQIQWYKLNDFLPIHRYRLSNNRYRLTIFDVQYDDRGKYYCQINDNHGHIIAEHKALLTVIALPEWKESIQDKIISLRQSSFIWHCQATGTNLQYRWYANGDIITNSAKYRSYPHNGTLIIHALQQSDSKVYTCMATNQFGNIVKSALAQFVHNSPPTFIVRPFAITKWIFNRTNKLICQADGFPTPQLSFTKNDLQLTSLTSSKLTVMPSNGTLIIHRTELSDEGIYQCIAVNPNGSIRIQTRVIIIPAFQVVLNYNSKTIRSGKRIRLTCDIVNQQYGLNHSISWSYSNSKIHPSKRIAISVSASSSALTIDQSLFNDTGTYTCHVVSYVDDYGYITNVASARVDIIDIPHLPEDVRIDQVTPRSVKLIWYQQLHSNRPITKIHIDYQLRSSGKWSRKVISADNYVSPSATITAVLDSLIPYHHYIIKLCVINSVGQHQINQEYQVTTLPDKPTMAPAQFYVSTTGPNYQYLAITWLPLPRQFHHGPNINYRLYYNKFSSDLWQIKEVGHSGHYILQDVISQSKYRLYLVAWNSIGESETKTPIATVITNKPPPNSLPPFPKLYVIGLSVVRVRFENVWNSAEIKISHRNKVNIER